MSPCLYRFLCLLARLKRSRRKKKLLEKGFKVLLLPRRRRRDKESKLRLQNKQSKICQLLRRWSFLTRKQSLKRSLRHPKPRVLRKQRRLRSQFQNFSLTRNKKRRTRARYLQALQRLQPSKSLRKSSKSTKTKMPFIRSSSSSFMSCTIVGTKIWTRCASLHSRPSSHFSKTSSQQ